MKKMIYNVPLATMGILMNGQKVRIGYWNLMGDRFYEDLPIYEGEMGAFEFRSRTEFEIKNNPENISKEKLWNDMKMRKINHLSAEGNIVVIGVDRYDVD